jgi:hypothetical protein
MNECPYHCQNGFILLEATGERVACPHCRGTAKYLDTMKAEEDAQSFGNAVYDILKIPLQYRGITPYSPYTIIENIRNYPSGGADATEVADVLTQIMHGVENNTVFRLSTYVYVPTNIDINAFVYGVQMQALVHEIGTMPYISLNTLYALLQGEVLNDIVSEMSDTTITTDGRTGKTVPMYRRLRDITGFDYTDYINSPLIFLEATGGTTHQGWIALADILAERAKQSLPTYVIGYWSFSLCGDGVYLGTSQTSRLDKLIPVEIIPNKIKHTTAYNYAVDIRANDSQNPNGVKVAGLGNVFANLM